mmetsp:Transcript_10845/g.38470  ORF Transcript_10845/g.38470 Transcript_10845/m.38470 type:complete len:244 (-) Transcript_10845:1602-2333(-)
MQSLEYQPSTVPPSTLALAPSPPASWGAVRSWKPPKGSAAAATEAWAASAAGVGSATDSPARRSSGSLWGAAAAGSATESGTTGAASIASSSPRRSPEAAAGRASPAASTPALDLAAGRLPSPPSGCIILSSEDSLSGNFGMVAITVAASFFADRTAYSTDRCWSSASGMVPYLWKVSLICCEMSSSPHRTRILAKAERMRPLAAGVALPSLSFSKWKISLASPLSSWPNSPKTYADSLSMVS